MKDEVLNLYKEVGETPLERLNRFRLEKPEYKEAVLSYAGRLDPLADGVLLVLVGDQNKNQKDFFGLEKEYEIEVLFGFGSDTYDILGLAYKDDNQYVLDNFENIKQTLIGEREEEYPAYSSKNVSGKPLFYYARNNKLDEIAIPKRIVRVDSIELIQKRIISKSELLEYIIERVLKVNGDFRQKEIIDTWKEQINSSSRNVYDILKLKVKCGEGAYMRTLCEKIGILLGTKALASSIKRTRAGNFKIEESIR